MTTQSEEIPTANTKLQRIFREAAAARRQESRSFALLAAVSALFWTVFALLPQSLLL